MNTSQSGQNFANVFDNEEMDFLLLSDYFKGERDGNGNDAPKATRKRDQNKSTPAPAQPNIDDADLDDLDDEDDGKDSKGTRNKLNTKRRGNTVDRRRERNRVLARKTRLRKKYFFEVSLDTHT